MCCRVCTAAPFGDRSDADNAERARAYRAGAHVGRRCRSALRGDGPCSRCTAQSGGVHPYRKGGARIMVRRHSRTKSLVLLIVDLIVLNILYHAAFILRFDTLIPLAHSELLNIDASPTIYYMLEAIISVGWIASGAIFRLYGDIPREQFSQEALRILRTMGGVIGVVFMVLVFTRFGINLYSRWFLFLFFCVGTVGLIVWRGMARMVSDNVKDDRNVLVVGAGKTGSRFYQRLSVQPKGSGYRVIGFLDNNGVTSKVRPMILGKLKDLDTVAGKYKIDEVVVALPTMSDAELRDFVNEC